MGKKVTDPALLATLNSEPAAVSRRVTDPALLAQLNAPDATPEPEPLNQKVSGGEAFKRGALDIGQGTNQLFIQAGERPEARENELIAAAKSGYIPPRDAVSSADYTKKVGGEIADYEARRAAAGQTGIDWPRIGGRVAATAPIAALSGGTGATPVAAAMLAGGAGGLATGGLEFAPTEGERAKNAVIGGVTGLALPGLGAAAKPIGATIAALPKVAMAAAKTTPALKGIASLAERAVEPLRYSSWNKALMNRVNPLAEKITAAGREGQKQLKQRFDDAYDAVWGSKFDVTLPSTGQTLTSREAEGALKTIKPKIRAASRRGDETTFDALKAQQQEIRDALPAKVQVELARVDAKFAEYARLRAAGSTTKAVKSGVFTPDDLFSVARRLDKSPDKGAFGRGEALMQDVAEARMRSLGERALSAGPTQQFLRAAPVPLSSAFLSPQPQDPFAKRPRGP